MDVDLKWICTLIRGYVRMKILNYLRGRDWPATLSNDTHHDMRRIHSTINNSSSLQDVGGATSNVHHQIT